MNGVQEFAAVPEASEKRTELLDGRGHGHKCDNGDLVGIWANAGRENGVSQTNVVGGVKLGFERGKLEVMLSTAFQEGADVVDMGSWVGVESYDVVEVGGYSVEARDDLVVDLDEPIVPGAATFRHSQPREDSGGDAEGG